MDPTHPYSLEADAPPLVWSTQDDALSNYSFLLPFEVWPDRVKYAYVQYDYWTVSLWGFAAYVLFVHLGQKAMSYRSRGFELRAACVLWNALAAVFSLVGFVRSSHELFRVLYRHGFAHSVCVSSYIQDAVFCFWIKAFIVSKFFEFVDTAFLVFRKRPVSFLHWYHHGTVLVFCWHGARTLTAAGRWFCWMNYGVHTVIYAYFALRTYGFGCPKWVSMCVTGVQMSQMAAGIRIGYTVYAVKAAGLPCHQSWTNLYMAFAIYSTFLVLFAHYFYVTYVKGGRKRVVDVEPSKKASRDENQNCTSAGRRARLAAKSDGEYPRKRAVSRGALSEAG